MSPTKVCSKKTCAKQGQPQPLSNFNRANGRKDGYRTECKDCHRAASKATYDRNAAKHAADPIDFDIDEVHPEGLDGIDGPDLVVREQMEVEAKAEKRHAAAQSRLGSEYETLKPGDLGGKDDYRAPNYDREKKQEFNANMGELMNFSRGQGGDVEKLSRYVSLLAEQESRWMNKRQARIHSLTHAREMLLARRFEMLSKSLEWPKTFGTYAPRKKNSVTQRILNLLLTDLHAGANMPADENPIPYNVTAFNRRLASVVVQACDYKPQYRDETELNMYWAGDGMEGNLLHGTQFDQDPTPVQLVAYARAMYSAVAYASLHFKRVNVWVLGGNHGRDKLLHPGRALASRKFNFERAVGLLVADRCAHLPNVNFTVPTAALAVVPLFDKKAIVLHGDAEAKLKAPSASGGHQAWQGAIDKFNAEKLWTDRCDALLAGHFHDPAVMYFDTGVGICNGPLIPPGGYARAGGYRGPCGQFLFESVPGFVVGDLRYIRVGVEQDRDASLADIIPEFNYDVSSFGAGS